jgi:L-alanine-DL-glutamate epimerase-like enolase superfamily enzyme
MGFSTLKLKGGLDPDDDVERVRAVRAAVGTHITLWLDANQGYGVTDTVRVTSALAATIELIEQPTPAADLEALMSAARGSAVPVVADESVQTAADALEIAGEVAGINIKLQKSGGLLEARRIAAICDASGMSAMIGCMDECALGISAGLQLALSLPIVAWADLDAHLDLVGDPTAGCLDLHDGHLYPKATAGLGLEGEITE